MWKKGCNKITTWFMVVCMLVSMLMTVGTIAAYAVEAPWSGAGIDGDPYIIASAEDLIAVSDVVYKDYWGAYFEQTADIDLSGLNWTPIGEYVTLFTGTYDGGGYTICNLTIDSDTLGLAGLFGYVDSSGTLQDITLENVSVSSSADSAYVGALVGFNYGSVSQCSSTGSLSGSGGGAYVGGLVGCNRGTITDSSSSAGVNGGNGAFIGGLAGSITGSVTGSTSSGPVSGGDNSHAGGLVGYIMSPDTVGFVSVGGSHSTGNVSVGANADAGGLVGARLGSMSAGVDIKDSSSAGLVTGGAGASTGGLIGNDMTDPIALDSIAITTLANRTGYTAGEPLDITGLVVTGTYAGNNTAVLPITAAHITGFDSSVPVEGQVLTVTYGGKETTYTVTVTVQAEPANPAINPAAVSFDLAAPADISVFITWGSAATSVTEVVYRSVTGDVYGSETLILDIHYTIDPNEDTLIIKQDYLSGLSLTAGTAVEFAITFNEGSVLTLTVDVVSNHIPSGNANLSGLTLSTGTLVPVFDPDVTGYTADVASGVGSVGVTPVSADSHATVTVNGTPVTGGSALSVALSTGNNTVSIVVTAENGTAKTYTVIVNRAAPAVTYTVTYHANGGTGTAPEETDKPAEATFQAADNSFDPPSGMQFKHWNTSPDDDGTSYAPGDTVTMPANPLNLYAIWEDMSSPDTYIVTIADSALGTATGGGTYSPDTTVTLSASPAAGYNFDGWYEGTTKLSSLPNYTFTVTRDMFLIPMFVEMSKSYLRVNTLAGGTVWLNDGSTPISSVYAFQYAMGTVIKLTATPATGYTFAYWADHGTFSIISTDPVYERIMGTDIKLLAVLSKVPTEEDTRFTVTFKDKSGRILQSTGVPKGTAATPPNQPALVGYSFKEWRPAFNNITSDMIITAIYERLPDTYTVTVEGGTLSTGGTQGEYQFDMPVTVVAGAAPDGQQFSHWTLDNKKVSTKNTFSFFAPMRDTTLKAVFVDEGISLNNVPFITLSDHVMADTANRTMMFTIIKNVPSGYTLVEGGAMLLKSNVPLTSALTVDTPDAIRLKLNNFANDQFYVRKINITQGDTWYARAYLIYRDSNNNMVTVYSDNTVNRTMGGE
ncbi:Cadherin-like beta sandwich domain protein [Pelotomaculum schinkii]|uniref:Cadherin-like beta sandwich domain protein n=1 Tax=Pelotomaculum schinkii TaxID=78350 RepID=A0A4Y7RDK1_9FIRM|nr:cadherin-like beta sandwich domain-containing protein [Pelotomaculum schinkii]TEB07095.1 Cadherin-like beta sandwich domain protein [Pelotomaculum schinkii]